MRIYSIFRSIDGEVNYWGQGTMCTFVRLAGCNLNCAWCDTEYAKDPNSGHNQTVTSILNDVVRLGCKKITITGGEPYLQVEELGELVFYLNRNDYDISIETNGSFEPRWPGIVSHVMDYKLPSSAMETHMDFANFAKLYGQEFVKFVIRDKADFAVATHTIPDLVARGCRARFAFSPLDGTLTPQLLLEWMDKEELYDSILNVQLHKLLELKEND